MCDDGGGDGADRAATAIGYLLSSDFLCWPPDVCGGVISFFGSGSALKRSSKSEAAARTRTRTRMHANAIDGRKEEEEEGGRTRNSEGYVVGR